MLILKRLDAFEEELKKLEKEIQEMKPKWPNTQPPADLSKVSRPYWGDVGIGKGGSIPCYFDNIPPEYRMKPMGLVALVQSALHIAFLKVAL
jgi:hypothetical protein